MFNFSFFRKKLPPSFYLKGRTDVIRVHITRTAGTSLSRAVEFNQPNRHKENPKHHFARQIIEKVGAVNWNAAIKFSFVRNPWDRLYSIFCLKIRKGELEFENNQSNFKTWLIGEFAEMESNEYCYTHSQFNWLKNFDGIVDYDFIGRFENLNEDVQTLSKLIKMDINIPHVNQAPKAFSYLEAYDDELEELVRVNYKKDLELFGYDFKRK